MTLKQRLIAVAITFAIIVAARIVWASVIHHDWRCAFAQCRIETP